jgi:hypothetical protein
MKAHGLRGREAFATVEARSSVEHRQRLAYARVALARSGRR